MSSVLPASIFCGKCMNRLIINNIIFQRRSVRQYKPVEYPIFKRQDAPFSSPQGITHMVASNGWISLIQPGNIIYRFHLDNPRGAAERKSSVKFS